MVAPQCSTICGSAAQAVAAAAQAAGCCEVRCATAFTAADPETVPEFDVAVADQQLVEVTVTGYVVQTPQVVGVGGVTQVGLVYLRGVARRFDGDDLFPGLTILLQDTTLQSSSFGLGTLPVGVATAISVSGNTLQLLIDSTAGLPGSSWRWDLEMSVCVKDQIVDLVPGGG